MFNINGENWRVLLVSPFHHSLLKSDGAYTLGVCDDLTKTIYINKNLNNEKFNKVLCHEVTHAAMFSYNIELSIEQEEIIADLFATYGEEIIDIANSVFIRLKEKRGT